jgi:mannose-6-phosphate isomerase-like protein (cupin superfamily)
MTDPEAAQPLSERYWYLEGTDARRIDVGIDAFWSQLMTGRYDDDAVRRVAEGDGWLVSRYEMHADMDQEEMHPHGDELHFIVEGRLDLVLAPADQPGGTARTIALRPGTSAAVPRGVWHRFVVHQPTHGIAITAGRGTQHRPTGADPEA